MANYWDTYNPGLLAGQDYWENFTSEAPTETGVVGAVTGRRYQPWERGYHNIAGLVDDSGEYDAWYDPDPPPETSVPDWETPEGYDNWADRIALETGDTSSTGSQHLPEGGSGDPDIYGSFGGTPWEDSFLSGLGKKLGWDEAHPGNVPSGSSWDVMDNTSGPFGSISALIGTIDTSKALLGGVMSGPLGAIFGALGGIKGIKSLADGTHPALQSPDTGTDESVDTGMLEAGHPSTAGLDTEYM